MVKLVLSGPIVLPRTGGWRQGLGGGGVALFWRKGRQFTAPLTSVFEYIFESLSDTLGDENIKIRHRDIEPNRLKLNTWRRNGEWFRQE